MIDKYIFGNPKEFENLAGAGKTKLLHVINNKRFYFYRPDDNLYLVIMIEKADKFYIFITEHVFYNKVSKLNLTIKTNREGNHYCYVVSYKDGKRDQISLANFCYKKIKNATNPDNDEFIYIFRGSSHIVLEDNLYKQRSCGKVSLKKDIKLLNQNKKDIENMIKSQFFTEEDSKRLELYGFGGNGLNTYYSDPDDENILYIVMNYNDINYKVLVDIDMYENLKDIRWSIDLREDRPEHNKYVYGYIKEISNKQSLHRYIMDVKDTSILIDHINKNPLDNRRCNLRPADYILNNRNQTIRSNNNSGCTGVSFNRKKNRWIAKRDIYEHGNKTPIKSRALKFLTFEQARECRMLLEMIPDHEFVHSDTPTQYLVEKYRRIHEENDLK